MNSISKKQKILVVMFSVVSSTAVIVACTVMLFFGKNDAIPVLLEGSYFDFGTLEEDENVCHSFPIYNKGHSILEIRKIVTSCSCTKAETTKTRIEPGENATIKVFYKARPLKMEDYIEVHVFTNSKKTPIVSLGMKCLIKTKLFWSPTAISLNKRTLSGEVLVSKNYAKNLSLENYEHTNDFFTLEHQMVDKGVLLKFEIAQDCPSGNWVESAKIKFLIDGYEKIISIPIYILNK